MALVVICGQPCSGKSTIAGKLADQFRHAGHLVTVVDEPSLHMLVRNESYLNAVQEKHCRGRLKSAVDRAMSDKGTIVILDSLNNIKGYRYELWCIARSVGCRYCMVHVYSTVEKCSQWNQSRKGDSYSLDIFADIAGRFERPDPRNRWDAPLFTIHPMEAYRETSDGIIDDGITNDESKAESLERDGTAGVESIVGIGDRLETDGEGCCPIVGPMDELEFNSESDCPNEAQVLELIVRAMAGPSGGVGGSMASTDSGVNRSRAPLQPTFATCSTPTLGTNTLHEIEQAAQDIITAIVDAQDAAAGGAPGTVRFNDGHGGVSLQPLHMDQPVTLAELRRHKRSFLKLATKILLARLQDGGAASRLFLDYLADNVAGASRVH